MIYVNMNGKSDKIFFMKHFSINHFLNFIDQMTPPAFLKCGEWLFPLEPGQSPILKTAHRTYMFPDIADNTIQV